MTEYGIPYDMDDKKAYKTGDYSSQSSALDANCSAAEGSNMEGHFLWVYSAENDHAWGDQWNGEDLSIASVDDLPPPATAPLATSSTPDSSTNLLKSSTQNGSVPDDASVTPENIRRTLTNPSISSTRSAKDPEITNNPGYRAAEAFVRPTPVAVAAKIISYGFDLRRCNFHLKVSAVKPTEEDTPTVVYLPNFTSRRRCVR